MYVIHMKMNMDYYSINSVCINSGLVWGYILCVFDSVEPTACCSVRSMGTCGKCGVVSGIGKLEGVHREHRSLQKACSNCGSMFSFVESYTVVARMFRSEWLNVFTDKMCLRFIAYAVLQTYSTYCIRYTTITWKQRSRYGRVVGLKLLKSDSFCVVCSRICYTLVVDLV